MAGAQPLALRLLVAEEEARRQIPVPAAAPRVPAKGVARAAVTPEPRPAP
jgi:hypothetical protein